MKLSLANTPTPLEDWSPWCSRLDVPGKLWVKRDDLTGLETSGNKIRKLEYLLAEAQRLGADTVFTCGGIQSNHARATAAAAVKLGMKPVLFLRGEAGEPSQGNFLLDRLFGATIVPVVDLEKDHIEAEYERHKQALEKTGRRVYCIPEGGSNGIGALGYLEAIEELSSQVDLRSITRIFVAVGSGGTYAGLLAGLRARSVSTEVVGINVQPTESSEFVSRIEGILEELRALGVHHGVTRSEIHIVDGYCGAGYAVASREVLELIGGVARTSGTLLDPVYTGKAFLGMKTELHQSKSVGTNLFWHTGGAWALSAYAAQLQRLDVGSSMEENR